MIKFFDWLIGLIVWLTLLIVWFYRLTLLIDWLYLLIDFIDWLVDLLVDWLYWLIDWLIDWLTLLIDHFGLFLKHQNKMKIVLFIFVQYQVFYFLYIFYFHSKKKEIVKNLRPNNLSTKRKRKNLRKKKPTSEVNLMIWYLLWEQEMFLETMWENMAQGKKIEINQWKLQEAVTWRTGKGLKPNYNSAQQHFKTKTILHICAYYYKGFLLLSEDFVSVSVKLKNYLQSQKQRTIVCCSK